MGATWPAQQGNSVPIPHAWDHNAQNKADFSNAQHCTLFSWQLFQQAHSRKVPGRRLPLESLSSFSKRGNKRVRDMFSVPDRPLENLHEFGGSCTTTECPSMAPLNVMSG
eukprot:352715-Chlamydomonas_euryale.AAC.9